MIFGDFTDFWAVIGVLSVVWFFIKLIFYIGKASAQ